MEQYGGTTYTYDDNGNTQTETLNGSTKTYSYNSQNELIELNDGAIMVYAYNPDGIRTRQTTAANDTFYVVDSNRDYAQVLEEVTNGTTAVNYTYGDDLISQQRNTAIHFYHYDGLGSTRGLSDATGSLTDTYSYDAFGEVLNQTGSTVNNYLFTGEQFDAGLDQYYLRARYYDQGIGRFTQMDTFQGFFTSPVTLHKYLYGNADPVNNIDPSGNISLGSIGTALNISARLASRSVANVGKTALRSFNQSISKIGLRNKNGITAKKKGKGAKKGKNKDEEAENFEEFMVMLEARMGAGYFIQPKPGKGPLGDAPRLKALYGDGVWIKMEWKRKLRSGKIIIIHYFKNINNNDNVEFKFKRRK